MHVGLLLPLKMIERQNKSVKQASWFLLQIANAHRSSLWTLMFGTTMKAGDLGKDDEKSEEQQTDQPKKSK